MRALWRTYGAPGGPAPGLVGHPYSLYRRTRSVGRRERRCRLRDGLRQPVHCRHRGRGLSAALRAGRCGLAPACTRTRLAAMPVDQQMRIAELVAPGSPAYEAGLEQDDVITGLNGKDITTPRAFQEILRAAKPGDRMSIAFTRRDGPRTATVVLKEDPSVGVRRWTRRRRRRRRFATSGSVEKVGRSATSSRHAVSIFQCAWGPTPTRSTRFARRPSGLPPLARRPTILQLPAPASHRACHRDVRHPMRRRHPDSQIQVERDRMVAVRRLEN